MRKLIAAFKTSLDSKIEGPEGFADWVPSWSEDYGLTQQIDACILGAKMYPGYEQYWTAIQQSSGKPLPMTAKLALPAEDEWGRFAAQTPHYVLSNTLTSANWPKTRFLRSLDEIAALKRQTGKDIYLMGGAQIASSCIEAGLLDELRLLVYPILAGNGKALFAALGKRYQLELQNVEQRQGGLMSFVYGMKS
jgi:dihydrofolate reductase